MFKPKNVYNYAGVNYIGIDDVADLFHVSTRTIYRWVESRGLPAYSANKRLMFKPSECTKWWDEQMLKRVDRKSKTKRPQQGEAS